jgi:tyrosinase
MVAFREAMKQAEDIPDRRGYNHIAGFHGAPGEYCWHHQFNPRTPVQARLFLPWHRAYLSTASLIRSWRRECSCQRRTRP